MTGNAAAGGKAGIVDLIVVFFVVSGREIL
jgi:hypothetical protein